MWDCTVLCPHTRPSESLDGVLIPKRIEVAIMVWLVHATFASFPREHDRQSSLTRWELLCPHQQSQESSLIRPSKLPFAHADKLETGMLSFEQGSKRHSTLHEYGSISNQSTTEYDTVLDSQTSHRAPRN